MFNIVNCSILYFCLQSLYRSSNLAFAVFPCVFQLTKTTMSFIEIKKAV